MFNKNHILLGIILGICAPIVGFALIEMLFEGLESLGAIDGMTSSSAAGRTRTLSLLAICANIIPFEIYRKKRYENTMRGLVFPTIIYVGIWIYMYQEVLLG